MSEPVDDKRFLVIQHIACEPPGVYEEELRMRGIGLERIEIDDEAAQLPDWRGFDAIIAMGGPMGVNDDAELPWLAEERQVIGEAVRAGLPYWGVCLGAQLLAASLGARVYQGTVAEVGVYDDVSVTEAAGSDPVFCDAPSSFTTLQWHSDTFELPEGSVLLASSATYRHQAFVWRRAYGLQFHLEVSAELAGEWANVPAYAASLEQILGADAVPQLVENIALNEKATSSVARRLFGGWLDRVVRSASSPSRV